MRGPATEARVQYRGPIEILDHEYSIHRMPSTATTPMPLPTESLYSVVVGGGELTVICRTELALSSSQVEDGWRVLRLVGPLDFSLVGVLAQLAGVLAAANICLFVLSSFETDYVLVRQTDLDRAQKALIAKRYRFLT